MNDGRLQKNTAAPPTQSQQPLAPPQQNSPRVDSEFPDYLQDLMDKMSRKYRNHPWSEEIVAEAVTGTLLDYSVKKEYSKETFCYIAWRRAGTIAERLSVQMQQTVSLDQPISDTPLNLSDSGYYPELTTPDIADGFIEKWSIQQQITIVWEIVRRMPTSKQLLFRYRYVDNLSLSDLARMYRCNERTIRRHLEKIKEVIKADSQLIAFNKEY